MNTKERLLAYLKYKGIKKAAFEKIAGLSNGFVDKMGDNTRSAKLEAISNSFPDLNINWLRTGEGSMIVGQEVKFNNPPGNSDEVSRLLSLLEASHETIRKRDEQIDRLITLLEKETERTEFINKVAV